MSLQRIGNQIEDNKLISEILYFVSKFEPWQLPGVYDMLLYREHFLKGDNVVKVGPRNAEQFILFLSLWINSGIKKYDEFLCEVLAKTRFKNGRWYSLIKSKTHFEESDKMKSFFQDLKVDLEVYIIQFKVYDTSKMRLKYLDLT